MRPSTTGRKPNQIRLWAVVFWLLVWQIAGMRMGQSFLLATPVSVAVRLFALWRTGAFWQSVGISSLRILSGFCFACLLGLLCSAGAARFRRIRELLAPLVATVKAVPVVSFIILALVWVDTQQLSFFIAVLMVFPPVYLNLLAGAEAVDRQLLEMASVFRVSPVRQLKDLYLPQMLPYIQSACSLSLGLCWKAGVAAEVIGLPQGTIGERLYTAKIYLETPDLFAWTLTIVALSVGFERLVLSGLNRLEKRGGKP